MNLLEHLRSRLTEESIAQGQFQLPEFPWDDVKNKVILVVGTRDSGKTSFLQYALFRCPDLPEEIHLFGNRWDGDRWSESSRVTYQGYEIPYLGSVNDRMSTKHLIISEDTTYDSARLKSIQIALEHKNHCGMWISGQYFPAFYKQIQKYIDYLVLTGLGSHVAYIVRVDYHLFNNEYLNRFGVAAFSDYFKKLLSEYSHGSSALVFGFKQKEFFQTKWVNPDLLPNEPPIKNDLVSSLPFNLLQLIWDYAFPLTEAHSFKKDIAEKLFEYIPVLDLWNIIFGYSNLLLDLCNVCGRIQTDSFVPQTARGGSLPLNRYICKKCGRNPLLRWIWMLK